MKLKKLQEALKSKQVEIKKIRTKPKINTKLRTQLNFKRSSMKTKTQEREMKRSRKKLIVLEPLPALANVPPQQLLHILAHRMRQQSSFCCHRNCPHASPE